MGKQRKFIMIIIVGILMILVARNIAPKKVDPKLGDANLVPKTKMVTAIVALEDLEPGTKLIPQLLKEKDVPELELPITAITSMDDAKKYEVVEKIDMDDLILKDKLKKIQIIDSLSWAIPKGKRAMTITVDKISGVGGFIKQGDYVDVLGIFNDAKGLPFNEPVQTILLAVEVLTIGQEMSTSGDDGAPAKPDGPPQKPGQPGGNKVVAKVVPYVTIAITREQAEILTLVREKARFSLLLRSRKDVGLSTAEVALLEKQKTLTRTEALKVSKAAAEAASAANNKGGRFAPPNRGGDMFGPPGTQGTNKTRPTAIGRPTPVKKEDKKPKQYRVETYKGIQDPRTVTVKD